MRRLHGWRRLSIVLAIVGLSAGCDGSAQSPEQGQAAAREVDVIEVRAESLLITAELPGRVEPVRVAEVRARVAGIVLKRAFEEGADVKAGDLLFQIDPAPLKAALSRAESQLSRADAELFQAEATVRRYKPLAEISAVSQQDYDVAQATLRSAKAAKRSAEADVETARLDLGYATVRAPLSGRIGRAQVTEGALVGQGEVTVLARIQQLDPVYVDFTQSATDALRLRETMSRAPERGEEREKLVVTVEGTGIRLEGGLLFADVEVDRSTGQIALRGQFSNPGAALLPGMYVRVQAPQTRDPGALMVPQRAVRRTPDGGAQVMVVGTDDRVEVRPVRTGVMQGARWQILEGLQPGDRVVTGGLATLSAGDSVTPRTVGAATDTPTSTQP